jgi:asparagine synthase (glutamine-hydrolysing)
MAHGVEARYPFLDHRVVDFAATLHPILKMRALREKHFLKQSCRGLVPPAIAARSKQPYRAPDGRSFIFPTVPPYVADLLSESSIRRNGVFHPGAVSSLLSKFTTGRAIGARDNMALTGILSTQLLFERFFDRGGAYGTTNQASAAYIHC